jgi:ABC-type lipoprotein export system ATPase subunit
LITHEPSLAARCDRQLQLEDGRIVGERASAPHRLGAARQAL